MSGAMLRSAVLLEERAHPVALQLVRDGDGEDVYDVVAIDAGVGNGWRFAPAVIERAAPLFGRVNVYLGHAGAADRGPNGERKPEHLAGVFAHGTYDPDTAAIRGTLRLCGPAAPLARAVADAYLRAYEAGHPAPDVGLSASLYIVTDGRDVIDITAVESLDVVGCTPARGGRFEAALAAMEDRQMAERIHVALSAGPPAPLDAGDAEISATGMPPWVHTLHEELNALRTSLAAQSAPDVVQNLGVSSDGGRRGGLVPIAFGQSPVDQLQTAVDALFGVRVPAGTALSRLRGVKDLYLLTTGDYEMRGVFQPEHAQFANATTTTLNDLVKNAINKYLNQYFGDQYLWWEQVAEVVDFGTLQDPTWITMGGFGDLPTVTEGATYTELTITDTAETSAWLKKGGYIGITLEAIDKDDTSGVTQIPRKLAQSAYRTLSAAVANIFTQAAGAGPTLSDGVALFHATHGNLGTTALTAANWEAAIQAMYKQTELNSGRRLGIRPERLLVPIELEALASQIVGSDVMDNNLQRNIRKGSAQVVTCPEFTDANDWVALADPMKNPAVGVGFRFGRVPEVFSDPGGQRMFTNDQMDLKARYFFTVGVIDYRAVRKHNVP
jgi:hypothetical protein